jgi:hypothetical protein
VCHARAYLNLSSLFNATSHLRQLRFGGGKNGNRSKQKRSAPKQNATTTIGFFRRHHLETTKTQKSFILLHANLAHKSTDTTTLSIPTNKRIMKFLVPPAAFTALLATSSNAFAPATTTTRTSSALFSTRQPIMAGNWKMNPSTEDEALALAGALTKLLGEETCAIDDSDEMCTEVVIFPPHPFISKVKETVDDAGITVGAQSIFFEDKVRTVCSIYIHTQNKMIIQKK